MRQSLLALLLTLGLLSGCSDSANSSKRAFWPNPSGNGFIRDPFPGNIIPADRLDPIARAMLAQMPTPQSGRAFTGSAVLDDGPQDQETLKVDHRWSGSWTKRSSPIGSSRSSRPASACSRRCSRRSVFTA